MDVRQRARAERSAYDDNINTYREVFDEGGFDGVRVEDERTILNPSNIRSQFARFDPRLKHLSNLNAANASPMAGLLAAQQEQPQNAMMALSQTPIDEYLRMFSTGPNALARNY